MPFIASKQFIAYANTYPTQTLLAAKIEMDEGTLSEIIHHKRHATATIMERVKRHVGWPLDDTWELIEE